MYVSLGLIICAAVIILLWFVTMFFMRLFRLKWRESARKVIRRNGKERVLRQTLSSFISESGDGMRAQVDTLETALGELESGNCPDVERRRLLGKARSAISSVRKSVDNLSYFQLLSEKRMNVSEVADAVGFNSVSYFSKAYKKRYGILPSEKR